MEEPELDEPPSRQPRKPLQALSANVNRLLPPVETPSQGRTPTSQTADTLRLSTRSRWSQAATTWVTHVAGLICSSRINVLLVVVPVGIAVGIANLDPTIVFAFNALAIIPLAVIISTSTEKLANRFGDTLGALLNVTIGNTAELMIFFIALAKDQIDIVQASLLGSLAMNMLLVLGTAMTSGSLRLREDLEDRVVGRISMSLLNAGLLMAIVPVTVFGTFQLQEMKYDKHQILKASRGISIALLVVYLAYLCLQWRLQRCNSDRIVTKDGHAYIALTEMESMPVAQDFVPDGQHKPVPLVLAHLQFQNSASMHDGAQHQRHRVVLPLDLDPATRSPIDSPPQSPRDSSDGSEPTFQATRSSIDESTDRDSRSSLDSDCDLSQLDQGSISGDSDLEDTTSMITNSKHTPLSAAIVTLLLSTCLVSLATEFAVSSIPAIVSTSHISQVFLGFIVLPVVGNAAKYVTATRFAVGNKMPLAKSVAIESSTQIVLFITPATVLVGWARGLEMSLDFDRLQLGAVLGAAVVVSAVVFYGSSGWRQGVFLLGIYAVLAVVSMFYRGV